LSIKEDSQEIKIAHQRKMERRAKLKVDVIYSVIDFFAIVNSFIKMTEFFFGQKTMKI